jgi:small subunit ribosomal protein S8
MSFNDPIAELLTHIRNAQDTKLRYVDVSISKIKLKLVDILKKQGFIENYLVSNEKRKMRIFLRYTKARKSVINGLKRISSPGFRKYIEYKKIPKVANGMGVAILSTSIGVIDGDTARKQKVGGEFLCKVW